MNKQVILKENIKGKNYQLHLTFNNDQIQFTVPDTGAYFNMSIKDLIDVYNEDTKTYMEYVEEREERERKRLKKASRRKLMTDIWDTTKKGFVKVKPIVKYCSWIALGAAGAIAYTKRGK